MSHTTILIHCVWSTKHREPMLINRDRRIDLFNHICSYAKGQNILIDCIGGIADHVHCLLFLLPQQNLSTIIQSLKGESARWYNSHGRGRIAWQSDYFAVSISPDRVQAVREYIHRQEEHHYHISYEKEYDGFIAKVEKGLKPTEEKD